MSLKQSKTLLGQKPTSSSFPPDILIFYFSPSHYMTPSSTSCSGKNPRNQWGFLPFPQGLLVLPASSNGSHLLTFPVTPTAQAIISHWMPARVSRPALLAATADPYSPFSTWPERSSKDTNHPLAKTHQYSHCSQLLNYGSGSATFPCLTGHHAPLPPLHSSHPGGLSFPRDHHAPSGSGHMLLLLLQMLDTLLLCNQK